MKSSEVIAALNKHVIYNGNREELKGRTFIFTGATIRKKPPKKYGDKSQIFYQAELQEHSGNTIIIAKLSDIEIA